ncbi:hypothetical protein G6F37_010384 [Rhizopus arrhizus]|nr:hypothetical protein G6F38_010426 [Rhizopus arrhizus]KAG1153410.1 hypothetical protein G6F37_010384 [Rhizopus arrhizus]
MNDQTYESLKQQLLHTLNPATQKEAAFNLSQAEVQQGFPLILLKLISDQVVDPTVRITAAVYFKNYIKRHWVPDNEQAVDVIAESDRVAIKNEIVQLMITVPEKIQFQISDALTLIAAADFPDRWEGLLPEMITKLSPTNYQANNGILSTAHSIFKRWRSAFRSDELFADIKYVLNLFCEPYFQLFQITDKLMEENVNNPAAIQVLARSLNLLIKIFYDLNCQDLPEFFEDNMAPFMSLFEKYLIYQNPLLVTDDDEEEGILEQIKTNICSVLELYGSRYDESFSLLPQFVPIIVNLLTTTGSELKYDGLICKAFAVLTIFVRLETLKPIFDNEDALKNMCEKIALPNVVIRTVDEELFEDNPIEYIRRDLEGSDTDTRRRSAADFIKGLLERYEQAVTKIMSEHIYNYLMTYNSNPTEHWRYKNTAIFLSVAISSLSSTAQQGVTKVNALVDVIDFFSRHVLCDLQSDVNSELPILKVDAIKYVYTFRNQLTKEQLLTVFPLLVKHLESSNYVVHTYAAIAIERILFIRQGKLMLFTSEDIKPYAETLLSQLFQLIEQGQTPEKLSENDYLMKAVMRVIIISRSDMMPYVNVIMGKLTGILSVVSKNPSNPRFNHYIFESIGALIRFICPTSPAALTEFENMCFGPFQTILSQEVQEFSPYVFQLLAQLLEQHKGTELTGSYVSILNPILNPSLWEQGNIPALVRLVQAYLDKGVTTIMANNQLEPILGIFQQKLVYSRQFDQYAMLLLRTITLRVPLAILGKYLPALLSDVLKRLQSKKKGTHIVFDRFTRNFTNWMTLCFLNENMGGPDTIIRVYDGLQPGLFGQILSLFILPDLSKLSQPVEKRTGAAGIIHLLTRSELMLQQPYIDSLWLNTLLALLKLIELPSPVDAEELDELYTFDLEEGGYQTSFAKLTTANPVTEDPTVGLPPGPVYLAQQLAQLPQDRRDALKHLMGQSEEAMTFLPRYFEQAKIPLI